MLPLQPPMQSRLAAQAGFAARAERSCRSRLGYTSFAELALPCSRPRSFGSFASGLALLSPGGGTRDRPPPAILAAVLVAHQPAPRRGPGRMLANRLWTTVSFTLRGWLLSGRASCEDWVTGVKLFDLLFDLLNDETCEWAKVKIEGHQGHDKASRCWIGRGALDDCLPESVPRLGQIGDQPVQHL
jgi:hypothetical protein